MFFFFEYILVAILIVAMYFLRSFPSGWFQDAEQYLGRLASRRALAVLVVGVLALTIRAALLPVLPIPEPGIHDDFAYLLMGDTFAHGRVANPTHPMWIHFESFHINHRPTYGAMFYPAQGLILALGQVIAGHPFVGVWLCAGAMCAAICWMLQGWLPSRWALLGGLLAVIRLGSVSYWANSYSGGALPAIGGALVLGGWPRLKRRRRAQDALVMGVGLAILASTRPYESLFFCLPVGVALFAWMWGEKGPPLRQSLGRIVLPLGLILAATVGGMAYYFWRTTGNPFRTPYLVNVETYMTVPYFPWQPLRPIPHYRHPVMAKFYLRDWQMQDYQLARSAPVRVLLTKALDLWRFYLGPVLTLPLLVAILPRRPLRRWFTGKTGFLWLVCGVSFFGMALTIYFIPHYAAPLTGAIYALLLQGLRRLRQWRWHGEPVGLAAARWAPAICVLMLLVRAAAPALGLPLPVEWSHTWGSTHFQNLDRADALARVAGQPGDHLVIVRYESGHLSANEWVYNQADLDRARVIWARDMGSAANEELIRYFPQRHVWLAEADLGPPRLLPYVERTDRHPPSRGTP